MTQNRQTQILSDLHDIAVDGGGRVHHIDDLADHYAVSRTTMKRNLDGLVAQGELEVAGVGRRGAPNQYGVKIESDRERFGWDGEFA
jgi:DeoR/GlpR family transcriptional regulator of sugar metabolism